VALPGELQRAARAKALALAGQLDREPGCAGDASWLRQHADQLGGIEIALAELNSSGAPPPDGALFWDRTHIGIESRN